MASFAIAGIRLVTDLALPELAQADGGDAEAWVVSRLPRRPTDAGSLLHETELDGRVWMRIALDGSDCMLSFPDFARFVVDVHRQAIGYFAEPGVGDSTLRHLLLDQVVPHVLAMKGELVLHASAVGTDQGALVFAGPSGCGKSSLAAEFAAKGCSLLADDFVLVRERRREKDFCVVPSYAGLRLWPDSADVFARADTALTSVYDGGDKKRVVSNEGRAASDSVRLAAVVLLSGEPEDGTEVSIEEVSAREGFIELFMDAFRVARAGPDRIRREFDAFAGLADSARVFRLRYRRAYEVLPRVSQEVLRKLSGRARPAT